MSERRRVMVRHLQNLEDLAPMGYTAGIHIRFASPMFLRSTYPQAWQDHYNNNNFALRDPTVFWGISRTGSARWSEITLPDPFNVMGQARDHGLIFGAVMSVGKVTSRTIIGIGRADREFTDAEIEQGVSIAQTLHDVSEPPTDLTPAMVEALRLVGEGFRHTAAAAELGISESAFKARLTSARDRLGAQTTAEALKLAREYRLI